MSSDSPPGPSQLDAASAKEVEDWRKLNAANAAALSDSEQQ
jgi:hypothetical protein